MMYLNYLFNLLGWNKPRPTNFYNDSVTTLSDPAGRGARLLTFDIRKKERYILIESDIADFRYKAKRLDNGLTLVCFLAQTDKDGVVMDENTPPITEIAK